MSAWTCTPMQAAAKLGLPTDDRLDDLQDRNQGVLSAMMDVGRGAHPREAALRYDLPWVEGTGIDWQNLPLQETNGDDPRMSLLKEAVRGLFITRLSNADFRSAVEASFKERMLAHQESDGSYACDLHVAVDYLFDVMIDNF